MEEHYRALGNEIVDAQGRQVAVILPTSCTKALACAMATAAAKEANHIETERKRLNRGKRAAIAQGA